ncbi:putative DivIVA domain protein [Bifidobacterium bombi DSM 19703]|uniref:Cell wall synthesis protein Wag31 n=1 Tax=Bifidobacterium bombi DSM 19703 TaxID=1341695 RepID=A0A080N4S6_9BIFI|nr:DivIVA domain-containing protein [Bifidobacterium bombi]KFF31675.1 putative DivIVA domain protein [Bifidobacterium bombi DSM 19703]
MVDLLTPKDIREATFNEVGLLRKGYDEDEVDEFLDQCAMTITAIAKEREGLRGDDDRGAVDDR